MAAPAPVLEYGQGSLWASSLHVPTQAGRLYIADAWRTLSVTPGTAGSTHPANSDNLPIGSEVLPSWIRVDVRGSVQIN